MTITFEDAEYVAAQGGPGRPKDPNPFTDVIKEIALKIDDKTGKPVAKRFTFEHPDADNGNEDDLKKYNSIIARYKRLASEAGDVNDPKVTVRSDVQPAVNPVNKKPMKGKSVFVFWTIKRQTRPRKTETTTTQLPPVNGQ